VCLVRVLIRFPDCSHPGSCTELRGRGCSPSRRRTSLASGR
jgi:hypothetical protein